MSLTFQDITLMIFFEYLNPVVEALPAASLPWAWGLTGTICRFCNYDDS
ncbi:MAG: hypothetical protein P8184_04355 [Calditrichia bacterium]